MKKIERSFMLDEDASDLLLGLAGGVRKQGEYLSELIRRAAKEQTVDVRIRALEAELARLKADVARPPDEEPR